MPRIIFVMDALTNILDQYNCIHPDDIELFAPVAYPIARIEVEMMEQSREDFDKIQLSVLKFIALGCNSPSIIADIMGLTVSYVQQIIRVLLSYEHINEYCVITDLGKQSLQEEKKITAARTKRIFLMDALNCSVIRLPDNIDKKVIVGENSEAVSYIPFLEHAMGVDTKQLENFLRQTEFRTLCAIPQSIDINVSSINGATCLGVAYATSYLLKLRDRAPMIFIKRYDFHSAENQTRFYWMPFSVNSKSLCEFLGHRDLPIHDFTVQEAIQNLMDRILEYGKGEKNQERIHEKMASKVERDYGMKVTLSPDTRYTVFVNTEMFQTYNGHNLHMLYRMGKSNVFLLADDNFYGNIVRFMIDPMDGYLKREACLIADKIDQLTDYTLSGINKVIREYRKAHSEDEQSAIDLIHTVLNMLLSQKQPVE